MNHISLSFHLMYQCRVNKWNIIYMICDISQITRHRRMWHRGADTWDGSLGLVRYRAHYGANIRRQTVCVSCYFFCVWTFIEIVFWWRLQPVVVINLTPATLSVTPQSGLETEWENSQKALKQHCRPKNVGRVKQCLCQWLLFVHYHCNAWLMSWLFLSCWCWKLS